MQDPFLSLRSGRDTLTSMYTIFDIPTYSIRKGGNVGNECNFRYGETSAYIMRECINESGKAFAVPKTSIYKSRMDMTILRMVQAGLPDKYLDDELEKAAKAKAQSTSKVSSINPLTLEQLGAVIVFQMIALAVCFATFLLGKFKS